MTKRVLNRIRLDKIAAVDKPCQEHATVAIIKRAPVDPQTVIAKATFQEALAGQLLSERVRDVFYSAFDNQYAYNRAFQQALIDELTAGGDGSTASENYTAAVRAMAESAASAARMIGASATDEQLQAAVEKAVVEWTPGSKEPNMPFTTQAALSAAIAKFDPTKSTVAERDDIVSSAATLGLENLLPMAGPLAKAAPVEGDQTKVLKRQIAVLSLSPVLKGHFDTLDTAAQDAFLAKSSTDQQAEFDAKNAADPVVYKMESTGLEIRKSDGAVALAMAKQNDQLSKSVANLTTQTVTDSIAKRAAQLPHTPNAASIIKGLDLIEDEAERNKAWEGLVAIDKSRKSLFSRVGTGIVSDDIAKAADSPQGRMDAIVKRYQAADPSLNVHTATVKAAADPEYQAAYADSIADQLPQNQPA